MKRKFYIISWVILGILFLGMYWLTRDNEPKKITSSNKTEKVVKNSDGSSRANKVLTGFENDIKKAGIFDKFEYNTENNVYIISKDINSMFSNKKGIEFFNISIKQLLDRNIVLIKMLSLEDLMAIPLLVLYILQKIILIKTGILKIYWTPIFTQNQMVGWQFQNSDNI
ncbi:TPA: hypothetical protein ACG5K5_001898 [Streptococcus agalactiae]